MSRKVFALTICAGLITSAIHTANAADSIVPVLDSTSGTGQHSTDGSMPYQIHADAVAASENTTGTGQHSTDGSMPYQIHANAVAASEYVAGTGQHTADGSAPYHIHADAVVASESTSSTTESPASDSTAGTGEDGTAGTGEHVGDAGAAGTDATSGERGLTAEKYDSANVYATAGTQEVQPAKDEISTAPASGKSVDEATLTQAKYADTTGTNPTTDTSTDVDNSATNPAHATQTTGVKTTPTKTTGTKTTGTKATGTHTSPAATHTSTVDYAATNDFIQRTAVAQQHTAQVVASHSAQLQSQEARLSGLESSTNSRFANLNKQVNENRDRASAGIAGVAAMANIPQVTQGQEFAVGAGVGNTDGQSAIAVGASARLNDNWVVKASVSNDTQQNFVVGAGASYGW